MPHQLPDAQSVNPACTAMYQQQLLHHTQGTDMLNSMQYALNSTYAAQHSTRHVPDLSDTDVTVMVGTGVKAVPINAALTLSHAHRQVCSALMGL